MNKQKRLYLADPDLSTSSSTDSTFQTASSFTDSTLQTAYRTTCFIKNKVEMVKSNNGGDFDDAQPRENERQSVFLEEFKEDLKYWNKKSPTKLERIKKLMKATIGDPFKGEGHPKLLKHIQHEGNKARSRKIDDEHRLVYTVTSDTVYFLKARYHYDDK